MLKLKLQYAGHRIRRTDSLETTLILGKIEGGRIGEDREWDGWMASLTQWTWVWVNSRRWWWTGRPGVLQFMGSQSVGHDWATELNWTELNMNYLIRAANKWFCWWFISVERKDLEKLLQGTDRKEVIISHWGNILCPYSYMLSTFSIFSPFFSSIFSSL